MIKIYYKKIFYIKDILRSNKIFSKNFKTHYNKLLISPLFLYKTINVYNGKKYIPIYITKKKIGNQLKQYIFNFKNKNLKKDYLIKIK